MARISTIDSYLEQTHGPLDSGFDSWGAGNVKFCQEMVGDGNQGILGPALEPVHGTARNQPRELQRSAAELFSNLSAKGDNVHKV